MTDELDESTTLTLPSKEDQADVNASPDWYLQNMVDLVNGSDTALPITVFVKGIVVSGLLVSGHHFFEGMREGFTSFFNKEHENTADAIEHLTETGKNYLKLRTDKDYPFPYFLHFRGAKVFAPSGMPLPSEGMWWRCRISEVDAFSFGMLAINSTEA